MTHTSMYRMKGLLTLAELLAQIGPEIAERTRTWLREALEPGETMPDVALLLKLVERRLRRLRECLRARDGRLSRALTALTVARRLRGLRKEASKKGRGHDPPNAAAVRRNGDVCRPHVASLRGNRRPSASARGGDRAKRWLLASSGVVDRRFEGLEQPENGEFRALRPWKEKIFAIFGR